MLQHFAIHSLAISLIGAASVAGQCSPRSGSKTPPAKVYTSWEEALPDLIQVSSPADCQPFAAFQGLTELVLRDQGLTQLGFLACLPRLEALELEGNELTSTAGIEQAPQIRYLVLRKNQISALDGLEALRQLQDLDLAFNKLTKLDSLAAIEGLRTLDVSANRLTSLQGLLDLAELEWVDISYNPLEESEIDQLRNKGISLISFQD